MKVISAQWGLDQGYPFLRVVTDQGEAWIISEQKMLGRGYDVVFLGADWEDKLPVVHLQPDAQRGPDSAMSLQGFTGDPVIVALTRAFLELLEDEASRPGPLPIPLPENLT